jgi:hypothetical protein
VLLVLGGVVAALLLTGGNGSTSSGAGAAGSAPSRAELAQEAAEERRTRKADEAKLERAVAADARLLAQQGVLRGPILRATCAPTSGGSSANLSSYDGRYDCLAVNSDRHVPHHGHIVEGVRFVATINFRSDAETFGGE